MRSFFYPVIIVGMSLGFSGLVHAQDPGPMQTHYGVKYDFTALPESFEPSELIIAVSQISVEFDVKIDGVKILGEGFAENMARIAKTAVRDQQEFKYVLIVSFDVAQNPSQIRGILLKEEPETFAQTERKKIEKARGEAVSSFFGVDSMEEKESGTLSAKLAQAPVKFVEGIRRFMNSDPQAQTAKGLEIYDYYLTFEEMFPADLDQRGQETLDSEEKVLSEGFVQEDVLVEKTYYESGALFGEYRSKDGQLQGASKEYYENGNLRIESFYEGDIKHGPYRMSYENGNVFKEVYYDDGKESGPYREYFEDGRLKMEMYYQNGVREGAFKEYREDGTLKFFENYKSGQLEGIVQDYYESGVVKQVAYYREGQLDGLLTIYYENGVPESEWEYVNGQLEGKVRLFDERGILKKEGVYREGKLQQ